MWQVSKCRTHGPTPGASTMAFALEWRTLQSVVLRPPSAGVVILASPIIPPSVPICRMV